MKPLATVGSKVNGCYHCLKLYAGEANGSIQWKMTHKPCLHVKTATTATETLKALEDL